MRFCRIRMQGTTMNPGECCCYGLSPSAWKMKGVKTVGEGKRFDNKDDKTYLSYTGRKANRNRAGGTRLKYIEGQDQTTNKVRQQFLDFFSLFLNGSTWDPSWHQLKNISCLVSNKFFSFLFSFPRPSTGLAPFTCPPLLYWSVLLRHLFHRWSDYTR